MSNNETEVKVATVVVNSESELNAAIQKINNGGGITTINVETSFTLTANVTPITKSLKLMSSNGSSIHDGGFSVITINDAEATNGANVFLAMDAGGTGMSYNNSSGNGTTLIGMTGGVLANLTNSGRFVVPAGHTFKVGEVIGSASVCGTLDNSKPVTCPQPYTGVQNVDETGSANGVMNDIVLPSESEGMVTVQSETNFTIKSIQIGEVCMVNSNGTTCGTITTSGGITASGDEGLQNPGSVIGVNVSGELTLVKGGIYMSNDIPQSVQGCTARTVINTNGLVELGSSGNWDFGSYTQTSGTLRFTIPNYKGGAPYLKLGAGTFSGGMIEINAGKYYDPKGFDGEKIALMRASIGFTGNIKTLVKFNYFPTGIFPSVEIENNTLYLILSVAM